VLGAGGTVMRAVARPLPTIIPDQGSFSPIQARVFAWLGEVADGRREQLPVLDAESQGALEPMRLLLRLQPQIRGAGQPTTGAGGGVMRIGSPAPLTATGEQIDRHPTSGSAPAVVEVAEAQRSLTGGVTSGHIVSEDHVHRILGPGTWAAIRVKPGLGLPARIVDQGAGGHVIAISADDFGSVRLNGGLVIPGRYYRIHGNVDIVSTVPLGIHIRPLHAVPVYHDQPLMGPSANG
jgi:hypothetical protein